jgi:Holliday junction DNA helicase RuvA
MFHHVTGTLAAKSPTEAVLEAGGVGYLIRIPASTYETLPPTGKPATLLTHLHVTDDALTLFGFATLAEREFFLQLIQNVNGVGPKVALAVLSGGRLDHIQQAIRLGDVAFLKSIRGVGDATAKRIVLELGKILVKRAEASGEAGSDGERPRRRAVATVQAPTITQMDEMTELAVKAVAQLNEVPRDVALKAVQRAFDEMRAEKAPPEAVQDLVQRALRYTE